MSINANCLTNTLIIPLRKDLRPNLDPHRIEDAYSMFVMMQLFRGLFRYTPSGDIVPDLAEGYEVSEDRKRYEFRLKKGARFSNGSAISPKHVKQSFIRLFRIPSSMAADMEYIEGVKSFYQTKNSDDLGIEATSDSIVFKLSQPSAFFLHHLASVDCAVLPLADDEDEFAVQPSTPFSGPYRLTEFSPHLIAIEKWRCDDRDSPNPPRQIRFPLDQSDVVKEALAGRIDSIDFTTISKEEYDALTSKGWLQTISNTTVENFVIMNPSKISQNIRQSLFSIVIQAELVSRLSNNRLRPAYGLVPEDFAGMLNEADIEELRVESHNASADRPLKIQYSSAIALHKLTAEYLAERLEDKGIPAVVESLPVQQFFQLFNTGTGDILVAAKGTDYFESYSILTYLRSNNRDNPFHVKDDKINSLLDYAVSVFEANERDALYKTIQKLAFSHYTLVPLFFGSDFCGLWSPKVKQVPAHPCGFQLLALEGVEIRSREKIGSTSEHLR